MTEREQKLIALGRHKARTDTLWLARNILGLKKVVPHVHGPMTDFLQSFKNYQGKDEFDEIKGHFVYKPRDPDPSKVLPEDVDKRRLLLAPRGWFKTSVNVYAHTVQLILNFPDITVLWLHASQEVLEPVLDLVKRAFWKNKPMRYYFPEFCAPETAREFGTQTAFNIPNRQNWTASPTVGIGGIESVRTGMHYHWIKFTDIVDEKNTATKDQIQKIIERFAMARNLLISPKYWMDVEGTRYHFGDLYGRIIDEWLREEKEDLVHEWKVFVMGCYKKAVKTGETFSPNELDVPYLLDETKAVDPKTGVDHRRVSRFPEESPTEALERMRLDKVAGEEPFNTQQLNNPVGTDNVAFPLQHLQWKTPDELKRIPILYYVIIVDLAETRNKRSDFTAITVVGVDRTNRRYVVDIRLGKFFPDEIIDLLFMMWLKWRPYKIKVEETGFARGLAPAVKRKSEKLGLWPNFQFIPPDNQISKTERIMSVQPMYVAGLIYFSTALDEFVKEELKHELTRFPKYQHDDILDTLADMYQDEPVYGDLRESKTEREVLLLAKNRLIQAAINNELTGVTDQPADSWTGLGGL
jgi:predicted phage terminase large subunit-like protein